MVSKKPHRNTQRRTSNQGAHRHQRSRQPISVLDRLLNGRIPSYHAIPVRVRNAFFYGALSVIVMIVAAAAVTIVSHAQSANSSAPGTPLAPNTVVLTFAGTPITDTQIDSVQLERAAKLLQGNAPVPSQLGQQQLTDFALYTLFDQIEVAKQMKLLHETTSTQLISYISPLRSLNYQLAHDFYDEHPILFSNSGPRIHAREIVVSDTHLAAQLHQQLLNGTPFATLARRYSQDPPQYRENGGDLGWISASQMPADWEAIVLSLSSGEISSVFQSGGKYCIVQLMASPSYDLIPYNDVTPSVPVVAAQWLQQEQFLDWLSALILKEPIDIKVSSYWQPVNSALDDLRTGPDQGLFSGIESR